MLDDREDEPYNDGQAFKIACRDRRGVMVTIIADNYFGYCKKEVKTQISFAANLFGLCEEEHAGGAIAYPAYVLGQDFIAGRTVQPEADDVFDEAMALLGDRVEIKPEGYAVDRRYPDHRLRPGDRRLQRPRRTASAGSTKAGRARSRCAPASSTCCPPATACAWKSSPPAPPGA